MTPRALTLRSVHPTVALNGRNCRGSTSGAACAAASRPKSLVQRVVPRLEVRASSIDLVRQSICRSVCPPSCALLSAMAPTAGRLVQPPEAADAREVPRQVGVQLLVLKHQDLLARKVALPPRQMHRVDAARNRAAVSAGGHAVLVLRVQGAAHACRLEAGAPALGLAVDLVLVPWQPRAPSVHGWREAELQFCTGTSPSYHPSVQLVRRRFSSTRWL